MVHRKLLATVINVRRAGLLCARRWVGLYPGRGGRGSANLSSDTSSFSDRARPVPTPLASCASRLAPRPPTIAGSRPHRRRGRRGRARPVGHQNGEGPQTRAPVKVAARSWWTQSATSAAARRVRAPGAPGKSPPFRRRTRSRPVRRQAASRKASRLASSRTDTGRTSRSGNAAPSVRCPFPACRRASPRRTRACRCPRGRLRPDSPQFWGSASPRVSPRPSAEQAPEQRLHRHGRGCPSISPGIWTGWTRTPPILVNAGIGRRVVNG